MPPLQGQRIWDSPKPYNLGHIPDPDKTRLEFPYLIRFRGDWYCAFREGQIHSGHPSGTGRIIRSTDGHTWEEAASFTWDGGDVRDPRLSVTAENRLMVHSSIAFVTKEPDAQGQFRQIKPHEKDGAEADGVFRQSVTWLSADGTNWSGAYACPTGINNWRWDVIWHNGMGYSVGYAGRDARGTLYRTRDGKTWRTLLADFFPEGKGTETALAFDTKDTAYALVRYNAAETYLGIGKPPYYQDWTWKQLRADVGDGPQATEDLFQVHFGGPLLRWLSNGRLLAAGRVRGTGESHRVEPNDPEGREDGRVTLFWVDVEKAVLTKFADFDGTSYPGVVEYENKLWVSYVGGDRSGLFLGKIDLS